MRIFEWPPGRGLAVGVVGCGLLAATAGCGSGPGQVALPKKPTHVQLARVIPAPPSTRQLVIRAYEGYWQATSQAVASRNPVTAKAILASYVPKSSLPGLITGMRALWRRDEVMFGAPVFHITSVKLTGTGTAAVHDCIDLSHTGIQNRKTGAIIGGLGQSHDFLITTLAYSGGRWLVTGAIPVVQACAY
jgi:hypothetical protein